MSLLPDPHVGDLAAALVDGELDHGTRERVLAHLAHCPPCRGAVDEQRRIKNLLHRLADPEPAGELGDRLRALAGVGAGEATVPPAGAPRRVRVPSARPRYRHLLTAAASVVALALTTAMVAGGQQTGDAVTPQVDRFVVEHAATTGGMSLTDPAAGVASVSFLTPTTP